MSPNQPQEPTSVCGVSYVAHVTSRRNFLHLLASHFMKSVMIVGFMVATILLAACGKQSPGSSATPTAPAQANAEQLLPVTQPAMRAWQQGGKAKALKIFVATDWNGRPLFEAGSALNLSQDQFKALPAGDSTAKAQAIITQISCVKQLSDAVAQAGLDAAAKGDVAQAREYFTSLRQFGLALQSPDNPGFVLSTYGKGIENKANAGLAKIGQ
jgi:hypothetical protein